MARHDCVAEFAQRQKQRRRKQSCGALPAKVFEREKHGARAREYSPVARDDVNRFRAGGAQLRRHRRRGRILIRHCAKLPAAVAAHQPGGAAATKTAVAVPQKQVRRGGRLVFHGRFSGCAMQNWSRGLSASTRKATRDVLLSRNNAFSDV